MARVYIINGEVVHVEPVEKYDKKINVSEFRSIDAYHKNIESYFMKRPNQMEVFYDRSLGFPRKFYVDPDSNKLDDEFGFEIFEVIPLVKKDELK